MSSLLDPALPTAAELEQSVTPDVSGYTGHAGEAETGKMLGLNEGLLPLGAAPSLVERSRPNPFSSLAVPFSRQISLGDILEDDICKSPSFRAACGRAPSGPTATSSSTTTKCPSRPGIS